MIGNDVIDLGLARRESDWTRKGFLDKLFFESEKNYILKSDYPEIAVWNLWSRKEAVYKIHNRLTGIRSFIPHKIECFIENQAIGLAICNGEIYVTQTEIASDFIHSIAVMEKQNLQKLMFLDREEVTKKEGLPFSKTNGKPISISHHGRFEYIVALQ